MATAWQFEILRRASPTLDDDGYGLTFSCVPVTARPPVCVACCVSVVVSVGGFGDVGCRLGFFPSAPWLGSGAGPGMPCAVGVSDDFVTGCVIAGGLFWS